MNWEQAKGNWNEFKGKVKQQWGDLTDDDIARINGSRDELVGHLQKAYGVSKEDADRQVRKWEGAMH